MKYKPLNYFRVFIYTIFYFLLPTIFYPFNVKNNKQQAETRKTSIKILKFSPSFFLGIRHDKQHAARPHYPQSQKKQAHVPILKYPECRNRNHRPHTDNRNRLRLPPHTLPLLKPPQVRPQPLGAVESIVQSLRTIIKQPRTQQQERSSRQPRQENTDHAQHDRNTTDHYIYSLPHPILFFLPFRNECPGNRLIVLRQFITLVYLFQYLPIRFRHKILPKRLHLHHQLVLPLQTLGVSS